MNSDWTEVKARGLSVIEFVGGLVFRLCLFFLWLAWCYFLYTLDGHALLLVTAAFVTVGVVLPTLGWIFAPVLRKYLAKRKVEVSA